MAEDTLMMLKAIAEKLGRGRGTSCSVVDAPAAGGARNEAGSGGAAPTDVVLPWLDISKVLRVTHGAGVVYFAAVAKKKRAEEPAADLKVVIKEAPDADGACVDPADVRNMLVKMAVKMYREALAAQKARVSAPGAGNLMGFLRSAVVHDRDSVHTLWCWA